MMEVLTALIGLLVELIDLVTVREFAIELRLT